MSRHTGDDGQAMFPNRGRISKAAVELCALGDLDELCATIGVVVAELPQSCKKLQPLLENIQRVVQQVSSFCAGCSEATVELTLKDALCDLDRLIAVLDEELPVLQSFVLPGGHRGACAAHVARTVCRRAERSVVAMVEASEKESDATTLTVMAVMNRLSSFLFSLARLINFQENVPGSETL